jgi:hypothetical protein
MPRRQPPPEQRRERWHRNPGPSRPRSIAARVHREPVHRNPGSIATQVHRNPGCPSQPRSIATRVHRNPGSIATRVHRNLGPSRTGPSQPRSIATRGSIATRVPIATRVHRNPGPSQPRSITTEVHDNPGQGCSKQRSAERELMEHPHAPPGLTNSVHAVWDSAGPWPQSDTSVEMYSNAAPRLIDREPERAAPGESSCQREQNLTGHRRRLRLGRLARLGRLRKRVPCRCFISVCASFPYRAVWTASDAAVFGSA